MMRGVKVGRALFYCRAQESDTNLPGVRLYPWAMSSERIPVNQWTDPRHVRGLRGEETAAAFLQSLGWYIEAHRFRLGRHDVDLIIRKDPIIAFVEVKTRSSQAFGAPLEAVGWRKQGAVARVAQVWRARFGRPWDVYRFDLVGLTADPGGGQAIEHVEDAWRLGGWR